MSRGSIDDCQTIGIRNNTLAPKTPAVPHTMAEYLIYHNPRCSTSRNALALLHERGIAPQVVEYLKTPPDEAALLALAQRMGEPLWHLLREKEPLCAELGLVPGSCSEAELARTMVRHPVLINRPIVSGPLGARLCRPLERVLEILPAA